MARSVYYGEVHGRAAPASRMGNKDSGLTVKAHIDEAPSCVTDCFHRSGIGYIYHTKIVDTTGMDSYTLSLTLGKKDDGQGLKPDVIMVPMWYPRQKRWILVDQDLVGYARENYETLFLEEHLEKLFGLRPRVSASADEKDLEVMRATLMPRAV